jgi:hypothetical protein
MPEAGVNGQATFLTGFVVAVLLVVLLVAFLTVALATLLLVWQIYHKRGLTQQR